MGNRNHSLRAGLPGTDSPAAQDASPSLRTVVSADADEFADLLSAWDQTYEQLARGRFAGRPSVEANRAAPDDAPR